MNAIKTIWICVMLLHFCLSGEIIAGTYYVDVAKGNDANDGRLETPFRTSSKAIRVAIAGDTILIVKVDFPIPESIILIDKSGEQGRPIVIDGQGNLFTGAEQLKPGDWLEVKPGLYRNDHLLRGLILGNPATVATMMRMFMVFDGQLNRMGRSCNGSQPPFKDPALLKPGEWTYVDTATAFYISVEPGRTLADYRIKVPVRQNGVAVAGTCKHLIIRNINVEHVINDGFNIHGHTEDVSFEHITATECGDDGISAHEDCSIRIYDFVARRNSTGLCHGDYNVSCYGERLVLEENYGYNLLLMNGTDTFRDCTISAVIPPDGYGGIELKNKPTKDSPETLKVHFDNCHILFAGQPADTHKKPVFVVQEDVALSISKNSKVDGKITYIPPRKRK